MESWEADNSDIWRATVSNKMRGIHAAHPNEHTAYSPAAITACGVYEAMQLAAVLWERVAPAHGYGPVMEAYPSFQQQYAELQRVTPNLVRSDIAAELRAHSLLPATVATQSAMANARPMAELEANARSAMPAFMSALDTLVSSEEWGWPTPAAGGSDAGPRVAFTGTHAVVAAAIGVVTGVSEESSGLVGLNDGIRQQPRDLLARFAQPDLRVGTSLVKFAYEGEDPSCLIYLGQTRAFVFEGARGKNELFVGQVRQLTSTSLGGKATKYFQALSTGDEKGRYLAHPYAKVVLVEGAFSLLLQTQELAQTYAIKQGSVTVRASQADSGSDEDDETESAVHQPSSGVQPQGAGVMLTNILDSVAVDWNGPTIAHEASVAILQRLIQLHVQGGNRASVPRSASRQRGTARAATLQLPAPDQAAATSPAAQVLGTRTSSGRQSKKVQPPEFQWG